MNIYLFRHEHFNRYYNCNAFTEEKWRTYGERHPYIGMYFMATGIPNMALYAVFMAAMLAKRFRKFYAYRLMFLLGVFDMINVFIASFNTGFLAYAGGLYCLYPKFIWFTGIYGIAGWCAGTMTICLIGFNRCIEWTSQYLSEKMFKGWRGWFWISLPIIYYVLIVMFEHPLFFDSVYVTWFHNPYKHIPELTWNQQFHYANDTHNVNNVVVVITLIIENIYLIYKVLSMPGGMASSQAMKKNFMIQVIWICLIALFTDLVFLLSNFIYLSPFWCIAASAGYQWNSASPAWIYLFLNKSLRTEVKSMMKGVINKAMGKKGGSSTINPHRQVTTCDGEIVI